MSKTLYLPEHVAQKRKAEKEAEKSSSIADSAYIPADERVLDPSLLDQPLVERLPQPTGWRILVMPYQGKAKTGGGLFIPDEIREREAVATVVAYVMRVGPTGLQGSEQVRTRRRALVQRRSMGLHWSLCWISF